MRIIAQEELRLRYVTMMKTQELLCILVYQLDLIHRWHCMSTVKPDLKKNVLMKHRDMT